MLFRVPNAPDLCCFESQMRFFEPQIRQRSKCARLMLFRVPNAQGLCIFESQMRWTYAFSSPTCAGLMLFRVPNAPDLCFFESQMRRTYVFSSPKCARLMLFRVPNAPDLCFFESKSARLMIFDCLDWLGSRWDNSHKLCLMGSLFHPGEHNVFPVGKIARGPEKS